MEIPNSTELTVLSPTRRFLNWLRRSRILKVLIAIFLMYWLLDCGGVKVNWSEEVLLSSGKTLFVKRSVQGKKMGELGASSGWYTTEESLTIDAREIGLFSPPEWRTAYKPVVLDYDEANHEWFIVATFSVCQGWYDLGRPALPYVEYRVSEGGIWRTVPLSQDLIGRKRNMLTDVRSGGKKKKISLRDKSRRGRRSGDKYQEIVGHWFSNC